MGGTIATDMSYCKSMLKEYKKIAKETTCKYTRRSATLRVRQYEYRIAALKAGVPRDQLTNLGGDCPTKLGDIPLD